MGTNKTCTNINKGSSYRLRFQNHLRGAGYFLALLEGWLEGVKEADYWWPVSMTRPHPRSHQWVQPVQEPLAVQPLIQQESNTSRPHWGEVRQPGYGESHSNGTLCNGTFTPKAKRCKSCRIAKNATRSKIFLSLLSLVTWTIWTFYLAPQYILIGCRFIYS